MKKIISIALLIVSIMLCVLGLTACTEGDTSGDNTPGLKTTKYKDDNYYTVTKFVPENDNEIAVLDIASLAEDGETIGRIKAGAFKGVDNVKSVIVPSTVEIIDKGAFASMKNLESITLPFIGKTAKADAVVGSTAPADKCVNEERNLGYIFGTEKYDYSQQLTQWYNSSSTSTAIFYFPVNLKEVIVKPASSGYAIPAYAFYGAKYLKTVTLSENVTTIGEYAFGGCEKMTAINHLGTDGAKAVGLSATLTKLERGAFSGCVALNENGFKFNANNQITVLGENTFRGTAFINLVLPDNVTEIGGSCYRESAVVTVSTKATVLGDSAFIKCKDLSSFNSTTANVINFAGLTEVGGLAFSDLNDNVTYVVQNAGGIDVDNVMYGNDF